MKTKQIIYDNNFDLHSLNKFSSVMALGNGYLGVRAAHEEDYTGQIRGMYVAGVYNKATSNETSDLVNLPDIAGMLIEIDGKNFSMLEGEVFSYERGLSLESGELRREFIWKHKTGTRFKFVFQRFAAKDNLHLLASKVTVTSLDKPARIKIITGINAQQTNFGRQHLIEESVMVFNEEILQGIYQTTETGIKIAIAASIAKPSCVKVSVMSA